MNIIKKYILGTIAAMTLSGLAVSCTQDEFGMLPESERSLKFTATVDGMVSRADDAGFWVTGDTIRVRISADESLDFYPWIGQYELNANGTVRDAIEALAWPFLEGYVAAWYPFLEEGTEVSITDQSKGYHSIDFLSAVTEGKKKYNDVVNLNFKHLMSKVRCEFTAGDGVTEEDLKTAKVRYCGVPTVVFSEKGLTGKGEAAYITAASDHSALMFPQDVKGLPFITVDLTVTVNDVQIPKTLVYTPSEPEDLKAGTMYTYKITVNKDRLVVQTITGEWNDDNGSEKAYEVLHRVNLPQNHNQTLSFSTNVTPVYGDARAGEDISYLLVSGKEFTISYDLNDANYMKGFVPTVEETGSLSMNCSQSGNGYTFQYTLKSQTVNLKYDDYAQVGDVYYSDGTWSRAQIEGKTPIGIVFKTGVDGTAPANKPEEVDIPENYGWEPDRPIRGYVVALKDASTLAGKWQVSGNVLLTEGNQNEVDAKYSGYLNAVQIRKSTLYPDGTWACAVADNYQPSAPVYKAEDSTNPYYSSGWYLPSIRQLWDLFFLYKLNPYLEMAGGTALLDGSNEDYWSSTEHRSSPTQKSSGIAFAINFYKAKSLTDSSAGKTRSKYVRSVLTF